MTGRRSVIGPSTHVGVLPVWPVVLSRSPGGGGPRQARPRRINAGPGVRVTPAVPGVGDGPGWGHGRHDSRDSINGLHGPGLSGCPRPSRRGRCTRCPHRTRCTPPPGARARPAAHGDDSADHAAATGSTPRTRQPPPGGDDDRPRTDTGAAPHAGARVPRRRRRAEAYVVPPTPVPGTTPHPSTDRCLTPLTTPPYSRDTRRRRDPRRGDRPRPAHVPTTPLTPSPTPDRPRP